jgi:hypothetical protein
MPAGVPFRLVIEEEINMFLTGKRIARVNIRQSLKTTGVHAPHRSRLKANAFLFESE